MPPFGCQKTSPGPASSWMLNCRWLNASPGVPLARAAKVPSAAFMSRLRVASRSTSPPGRSVGSSAALRLFELMKVGVELLLVEKCRAVDALERMRVLVPLPARPCDAQQFHRLDAAGRRDVRAAAEIQELAGAIGGEDRLGLLPNQFALQELSLLLEELEPFVFAEGDALVGEVCANELLHLQLDLREVGFGERLRAIKIVKKSRIGRRTDARVRVGIKLQDRRGKQVCGGMAVDFEPLGRIRRDQLDGRALLEPRGEVHEAAVYPGRKRLRREPWPNGFGHFQRRDSVRKFLGSPVGEGQLNVRHPNRKPGASALQNSKLARERSNPAVRRVPARQKF